MKKTSLNFYNLKKYVFCFLMISSAFINAQIQKPFTPRYNKSLKGDATTFNSSSTNFTKPDNINPTASNPKSITIDCEDEIPIPDTSIITDAFDNTSTPTITFVSESSSTQNCTEVITRIYNIADTSNNYINVKHLIYIEDTTPPTLISDIENEITLVCGIVPNVEDIEFIDNCTTNLTIQFEEVIVKLDNKDYDIVRTWKALDDCDNLESVTQTIHMRQTIEFYTNDIQLCINEDVLNLIFLVDANTNGIWESKTLDVLDGTLFNPGTLPEGNYLFTYTVNTNKCSIINIININLNDNCIEYPCVNSIFDIDISKLITPNGDAKNETFTISYNLNEAIDNPIKCNIITTVKMFNRWGIKVFESDNYNNDWTGNTSSSDFGSDVKLPTGTYYYTVDLINSGLNPIQGFILLDITK